MLVGEFLTALGVPGFVTSMFPLLDSEILDFLVFVAELNVPTPW